MPVAGRPSDATLTISRAPDLHPDARVYRVDCAHAWTEGLVLPPTSGPPRPAGDIMRTLFAIHDQEEACGCTARLWRRYGRGEATKEALS